MVMRLISWMLFRFYFAVCCVFSLTSTVQSEVLRVIEVSETKPPEQSPYQSALFTMKVAREENGGTECVASGFLFLNTKLTGLSRLVEGDTFEAKLVDFESRPKLARTAMTYDDLGDFSSTIFWIQSHNMASPLEAERPDSIKSFLKFSQDILQLRANRWWGGEEGYYFSVGNGKQYNREFSTSVKGRAYVDAIARFRQELDAEGVNLVVMIPPCLATTSTDFAIQSPFDPEKLGPINRPIREFLNRLEEESIQVIDLTEAFIEEPHHEFEGKIFPVNLKSHGHWSSRGAVIAAEMVTEMNRHHFTPGTPAMKDRTLFPVSTELKRIISPLRDQRWIRKPFVPERSPIFSVKLSEELLVEDDPDSPVYLLGDSFPGWLSHLDAGMHAHLVRSLGLKVFVDSVPGRTLDKTVSEWRERGVGSGCRLVVLVGAETLL